MILRYLKKEHCILDLKAETREAAIEEIARACSRETSGVTDADLFLKDILSREQLGSTGIGFQAAIPHARTTAVNDFVIGIGRSVKGIEFGSVDKEKVHLIFLMGANPEGLNLYLRMLAQVSRFIMDKSFRQKLLNASTSEEIVDIFRSQEALLAASM